MSSAKEKVDALKEIQKDLELGESLEAKHGLSFTDEEREQLKNLRQVLPVLEEALAVIEKIEEFYKRLQTK